MPAVFSSRHVSCSSFCTRADQRRLPEVGGLGPTDADRTWLVSSSSPDKVSKHPGSRRHARAAPRRKSSRRVMAAGHSGGLQRSKPAGQARHDPGSGSIRPVARPSPCRAGRSRTPVVLLSSVSCFLRCGGMTCICGRNRLRLPAAPSVPSLNSLFAACLSCLRFGA